MTDPLTEMLASLKERLRAATPGRRTWRDWMPPQIVSENGGLLAEMTHYGRMREDAAYIAALDPDLVAALIGCVEALGAILAKHPDKCEHIHAGWGALAELRKLAEGRRG